MQIELGKQSKRKGFFALVDAADYERTSKLRWSLNQGYAYGWVPSGNNDATRMNMARFILDCPKELVVDHINGNKLDNRRENLRSVTHRENIANRTRPNQHEGCAVMAKDGIASVVISKAAHQLLKEHANANNMFVGAVADSIILNFFKPITDYEI